MLPISSHSSGLRSLAARAAWTAGRRNVLLRALRLASSHAQAEVVRASQAGLLVQAPPGTTQGEEALVRGSIVQHDGCGFVCTFSLDRFWFAAPLGGAQKASACWLGRAGSGASNNHADAAEDSISCLGRPTPTQKERAPLAECVPTGILAVDTLAPLGKGQSMLVCGPHGTGKSTLAREILEQALTMQLVDQALRFRVDPCAPLVGAAVQCADSFAELVVTPEAAKLSPAMLLAPMFAAVDAAEVARDSGKHVLLVLDTVAPLLDAWNLALCWAEDALGRALDDEAVAAQRRNCFASLSERAASLIGNTENCSNAGSLTLLILAETDAMAAVGTPAIAKGGSHASGQIAHALEDFAERKETERLRLQRLVERGVLLTDVTLAAVGIAHPSKGDVSGRNRTEAAAMRELQSLSDGQIVLDATVAEAGDFPALVPGATFSRFGLGSSKTSGQVQPRQHRDVRPPALQAVAAHLRMQLALEQEARFRPDTEQVEASVDVDGSQSARMRAVRAALLQPPRAPMQTEEMAVVLLAACGGALDELSEEQAVQAMRGGAAAPLLQHLRAAAPRVLQGVRDEQRLSVEAARELEVAVRLFVELQRASAAA